MKEYAICALLGFVDVQFEPDLRGGGWYVRSPRKDHYDWWWGDVMRGEYKGAFHKVQR